LDGYIGLIDNLLRHFVSRLYVYFFYNFENMHAGFIFLAVIVGSVLFHIFTPWWWTDIASKLGSNG